MISGGISTLSSDLINQLGLKSGDLVVLGKQLYHITNSGYSKITGSLVNKYAKGSEYIPYNQYALVDEEGPELHAHKNSQGRITHLEKGDEIVPAKDTNTLASLVDYVNDPKNTNDPETDHLAKILEASEKIHQNFSIYSLFEYSTLNPYEQIMKSVTPNIEYIVNNNQSTVNHNYNVGNVELKNINNVDDIFRGLSNMAMQSTFKR